MYSERVRVPLHCCCMVWSMRHVPKQTKEPHAHHGACTTAQWLVLYEKDGGSSSRSYLPHT
jgi:hypothetical protein